MNRAQLQHVLRAAATIVDDPDVLVIGSQSILGAYPEDCLPVEATTSIEANLAFFDDPDGRKADQLEGAIGELSRFHETFGYYAQGVSVATAVMPAGWRERLVEFAPPGATPARARCLEPHDCVASKLVAGREKDLAFAHALLRDGLIDSTTLEGRIRALPLDVAVIDWLMTWVRRQALPRVE
ncbi:MAG TPA: hypothetical protein VLM76_15115 [Patescibacteria group bacterium]|nr:hypothetical protein [Patescibacteria group bacterium]